MLEEDCTEGKNVKQAKTNTSAGAERAAQPQTKKSRLESTANTKTAQDRGKPTLEKPLNLPRTVFSRADSSKNQPPEAQITLYSIK